MKDEWKLRKIYRSYLSLGSNLGDRAANLARATEALDAHPRIRVLRKSSYYETEPVGFTEQPDFLNSAVEIETELSPHELLQAARAIEDDMGRVRTFRWGPRVIDIDVLIYEGSSVDSEELIIPHPRMLERAFVLAPLAEIAPDLELPNGGRAAQVFSDLPEEEKAKVRREGE